MAIISVNTISKKFGDTQAVKDLSFDVQPGEIFGLLGPNGAGKTTTIRMILDIFKPDSGQIEILGGPMSEEKKNKLVTCRKSVAFIKTFPWNAAWFSSLP